MLTFPRIAPFMLPLVLAVVLTGKPSSGFQAASTPPASLPRERAFDSKPWPRSIHHTSPLWETSSGTASSDDSSPDSPTPALLRQSKSERRVLLIWLHAVSIFVVVNYMRPTLHPGFLLMIPRNVWSLIHALSAMVFAGGIVTTTLLEWNLPYIGNKMEEQRQQNNKSGAVLLNWLWQVESRLVLPAVTMSLISGVAQSFHYYATLRFAPKHVKSSLHVMLLFGIWWAWTDRRSQASLRERGFDDSKVIQRRLSNIVSCAFLVVLYSIMILKPGVS